MTTIAYKVERQDGKWLVSCEGRPGMAYVSQEAAFEAATAAAGGALRSGGAVVITVASAVDPLPHEGERDDKQPYAREVEEYSGQSVTHSPTEKSEPPRP